MIPSTCSTARPPPNKKTRRKHFTSSDPPADNRRLNCNSITESVSLASIEYTGMYYAILCGAHIAAFYLAVILVYTIWQVCLHSIWYSRWRTYCHSIWRTDILYIWLYSGIQSGVYSGILFLAGIVAGILSSGILSIWLVPTAIWRSWLRSMIPHCHLVLMEEEAGRGGERTALTRQVRNKQ